MHCQIYQYWTSHKIVSNIYTWRNDSFDSREKENDEQFDYFDKF